MCCLLSVDAAFGQLPNTGLYFYSHQQNKDERTSLVLNNDEPYHLNSQDIFSLEFDIFLRSDTVTFGYFFRILSNKKENFDLIINNEKDIFFVINNKDYPLSNKVQQSKWNHFLLTFDKKSNKISLKFNNEIIECPYDLNVTNNLLVYFGICDNKGFASYDVSPIVLKDVIISYNGKKFHHWMLAKHAKNIVYDELKNKPAKVNNPYWLMNNRIQWNKCAEFESNVFPQITFDSYDNRIFLLNPTGYTEFSLADNSINNVAISGDIPRNKFFNRLLFDPCSRKLLYYGPGSDGNYFIDVKNKTNGGYQYITEGDPTHSHHNRYVSIRDSMLYLFGGYGFYQYKSDFFKINLKTNEKTSFDLSHTIIPRYLAAMGGNKEGDKLYIFGGRGAEMGRQELSPKNFSDLYEIDLNTMETKLLYDFDTKYDEDNVYSNSLIMDDEAKCFYVLAFQNNKYLSEITLKEININTQKIETLADSIEFYFRDTDSFCDLYYSPEFSKLIAVASYSDDQQKSKINIYTLDYPPLKESDVIQIAKISSKYAGLMWIIASLLLLIISISLLLFLKLKGKKKQIKSQHKQEITPEYSFADTEKNTYFSDIHNKSILFFGGFQVYNNEGKNITGDFTPTLKYILVLILLYTSKDNKGISSSKLQELLWFDKSEEAARNNRSVNMRKLRVLLQTVGNIDINSNNGYWTISIENNVFSDYQESLRLIEKIQSNRANMPDDVLRLLELLSYGPMLPNIQFEWVDSFKNDFANSVIDILLNFLNNPNNPYSNNHDLRIKIADVLLKIDPISEEAIAIKCNALFKIGKKGLAKATFDNFAKEYHSFLGETYTGSLKNFLD